VIPPDAAEMARRLDAVLALCPWLCALDDTGAPIGYASASRRAERAACQWSVDAAVYVRQGHHRRGVGRAHDVGWWAQRLPAWPRHLGRST